MTKLYFLLALIVCYGGNLFAQTVLLPGDIAVISFKTNTSTESGNDAVKLVTLVDLECNTKFIVTDNNWNGTAWACNNDEAALEITCNTSIAAGSVFYIDYDAAGNTCFCSGGSITRTDLGSPWGTNFGFNSQGDNVYILQGTRAAPQFVYAFKHNGAFATNTCSDKDRAALPSNLTLGTSAIVMSSTKNQWNFNCVVNSGNKATILAAISNNANWINNTTHVWDASNGIFKVSGTVLPYGVLQVSGAGCGFLSNCLLAYYGAANSAAVTGNCTAGQIAMSASISVPGSGCVYKVIAEMRSRSYTCSSSGMDSGDQLKVDIFGGVKPFLTGASNANISDNYTLTGPGTIVVSGTADRADEIITYSIQASPCTCLMIALPVELIEFTAKKQGNTISLNWRTASEKNNATFTIERSADANKWETISEVMGQGSKAIPFNYCVIDATPLNGVSYYRLKQTDHTGLYSYSKILAVDIGKMNSKNIIRRVNTLGQEVDEHSSGIILLIYDDGSVEKTIKNQQNW